jgi:type IV pilus assembly protein PilV
MGQHGFTLVEVLVTVVILAVGLLGLAGLQAVSMRNNHSAYERTQAVQLAYDMADRVRANTEEQSNFDKLDGEAHASCTSTSGCNASEMAENDVYEWMLLVRGDDDVPGLLPVGDAIICRDSTPDDGTGSADVDNGCDGVGNIYAVKVWWNDNRAAANVDPQRFVMSFRP